MLDRGAPCASLHLSAEVYVIGNHLLRVARHGGVLIMMQDQKLSSGKESALGSHGAAALLQRARAWLAESGAGRFGSALLSLLLLAAIGWEITHVDFSQVYARLPVAPVFWLAFALYFWGSPAIEYYILRLLWNAPFSGFWAVLRKMVYNELVLSYLGDAYFFAWLKRTLPHVTTPFAVVKDMAIISAFMGSLMTMIAILIVWPFFPAVDRTGLGSSVLLCLALALASGGAIAVFRKALLSLSRREILWIGGLFGARIIGQSACAVVMWWSLLPEVPVTTWILLSAVRMVSARLPLVPSKDLAFAALTVAMVGPHDAIAPVIVMITSLILLGNILLAGALSLGSWVGLVVDRRTVAA